jgi:mono/diheme cytochrome c family protein
MTVGRRRSRSIPRLWSPTILAWISLLACSGCDQGSKDVRPWSPADHDDSSEPLADRTQPSTTAPDAPELRTDDSPSSHEEGGASAFMTWARSCVPCHGRVGRGDGPTRGDLPLPDLSDAAWQRRVSDADLVRAIREGKDDMPAFPLPDLVLEALAGLIRQMGGEATAQKPPSPAATQAISTAPEASNPPSRPQPSSPAP